MIGPIFSQIDLVGLLIFFAMNLSSTITWA